MSPLALAVLLAMGQADAKPQVEISPNPTCYQPITITFAGPEASETGEMNPFRDIRCEIEFSLIGEERGWLTNPQRVPGYFAADGNAAHTGATSGDRWRFRFLPRVVGKWHYRIRVFAPNDGWGPRQPSEPSQDDHESFVGDGLEGSFDVAGPDSAAPGFYGTGPVGLSSAFLSPAGATKSIPLWTRLELPKLRGLFLKAGADSPENLLAYADFDGTKVLGGPQPKRDGESSRKGLHTYAPHVRDWKEGDPTWRDGKGKGLIGALNYLASQGVNSVYFLPMNVEGDGQDVWPWIDEKTRDRFDVSKLDQWEIVFDHAAELGIVLDIVLTETENESLFEALDGPGHPDVSATEDLAVATAPFADTRKLYYRELVARFAYHPAIVWNLGEENGGDDKSGKPFGKGNTTEQRKAFATFLKKIDPHQHPIVVHTYPGQYEKIYEPLLGFTKIDGISLQMGDPRRSRAEVLKWLQRSNAANHAWFVCVDEIGPADTGVVPDDVPSAAENHKLAREVLWGNLLAGGSGVEWYFGYKYHDNDLNCEDFRSRESVWKFTKAAVDFYVEHLYFNRMDPADEIVHADGAFCFSKSESGVYAAYLPSVAKPVEMDLPEGDYTIHWFDPRSGGELQSGDTEGTDGGKRSVIGSPPTSPNEDWVVLVRKRE